MLAPSLDDVPDGDVVMLENVRFEPGETKNDPELAKRYAALADVYVNDAFGAAHRAHASTEAVAHLLPSAAGRLLEREVATLKGILAEPERPLVAVVGGAKVTDKIGVLEAFLQTADRILIGGAMCFPFFKAQGHEVGDSLCEEEGLEPARKVLAAGGEKLRLPVDLVAGRGVRGRHGDAGRSTASTCPTAGWGSTSARAPPRATREVIRDAGTVFWNGPMGAFELEPFAAGTRHGRRGRRGVRRGHRRRRRRLRRRAGPVRPGRRRHPPLHGRRRLPGADRGQGPPGRGGPVMSRTPFIAGNWKMHKTVAEAEQFIQALLPQGRRRRRRRDRHLPAVPGAAGDGRLRARLAGRRLRAEHARGRLRARSPARCRRRCSPRSTSHGVILGHSERREYYGETDAALQKKVPKALEAGLTPILCVGETEEERERGETERKLRRQVEEGLEQVPAERLADVVVAYEPIWAIGTGLTATPEQAQEACAFVRALVARFDEGAAEQVRVLYGGSCKPANAAELLALPDVDGALVGGASLDPSDFAAIVEAATLAADASRPVCLVVLDGWGLAPDGPGNAVALADTPVFDRLWAEHPHTTLTACGEAVGLPAGQMGNSEVGHLNLGAGSIVPQDLARIDKAVADGSLGENETLRRRAGRRRARAPDRARLRRRRALLRGAPEGADPARRRARRARPRDPRLHRRARHVADVGRGVARRASRRRARRPATGRIGSVVGRYFAMDRDQRWDRTEQARRPALRGHGRAPRGHRRGGGRGRLRARRDRRVHHRDDRGRGGADPPRRRRARLQLPPRPDAPDHDEAAPRSSTPTRR